MIRDATSDDLPALVRLLGQLNEGVPPPPTERHRAAFEAVAANARQRLLVVERDGAVVGTAGRWSSCRTSDTTAHRTR